jgi:hypothetical protein
MEKIQKKCTFRLFLKLFYKDLVAHTCNSSYLGGRDQEDHSSTPDQANS